MHEQLYDKRCVPASSFSIAREYFFDRSSLSPRRTWNNRNEREPPPRAHGKEREREGGGRRRRRRKRGREKRRKLNRFRVRREERTLRCDSRLWRRSASLQSRNPAFPLGKAEDYGNGYDGERRVPLKTEESGANGASSAVYRRRHRRRFSIHAVTRVLGQGRKSPPLPFPRRDGVSDIALAGHRGKRTDKRAAVPTRVFTRVSRALLRQHSP